MVPSVLKTSVLSLIILAVVSGRPVVAARRVTTSLSLSTNTLYAMRESDPKSRFSNMALVTWNQKA